MTRPALPQLWTTFTPQTQRELVSLWTQLLQRHLQAQRVPLVAYGPKASELAQYAVGQVVTLRGFIRSTERGLELVVMRHELAGLVQPAAEAQPETSAEAPKARGRGRKKAT